MSKTFKILHISPTNAVRSHYPTKLSARTVLHGQANVILWCGHNMIREQVKICVDALLFCQPGCAKTTAAPRATLYLLSTVLFTFPWQVVYHCTPFHSIKMASQYFPLNSLHVGWMEKIRKMSVLTQRSCHLMVGRELSWLGEGLILCVAKITSNLTDVSGPRLLGFQALPYN